MCTVKRFSLKRFTARDGWLPGLIELADCADQKPTAKTLISTRAFELSFPAGVRLDPSGAPHGCLETYMASNAELSGAALQIVLNFVAQ